jgi:hypothetical protein
MWKNAHDAGPAILRLNMTNECPGLSPLLVLLVEGSLNFELCIIRLLTAVPIFAFCYLPVCLRNSTWRLHILGSRVIAVASSPYLRFLMNLQGLNSVSLPRFPRDGRGGDSRTEQ